jgi:predicted RNA-binding Zn ribbon-like protein
MAPELERSGGGVAVDLAGTVTAVGTTLEADLLTSAGDLRRWLEVEEPWLGPAPPEAALRLADFRDLRASIRSLFGAVVEGRPVPADAVDALNAASAAAPGHRLLDASDPREPLAVDAMTAGSPTVELLARTARSAIQIVGGPDRRRLRVCPAPRCGRFYLASRGGQVWCGDACGNRARVARHHERRRASGGAGARA